MCVSGVHVCGVCVCGAVSLFNTVLSALGYTAQPVCVCMCGVCVGAVPLFNAVLSALGYTT